MDFPGTGIVTADDEGGPDVFDDDDDEVIDV